MCMLLALSKERVSRWTVRPVNLGVAIHTAASDQSVAAGHELAAIVDGRRMSGADMTPLAEHRQLRNEHPLLVRSMRIVARVAGLANRRVVPQIRAALLGVTADARFVHPIAHSQQAGVGRPVRVMTRRAIHLARACIGCCADSMAAVSLGEYR